MTTDEFAALLAGFSRDLAGAADAAETVSVRLARHGLLRNDAITASGLTVSLDEPVHFGGEGLAPDPAEHLLAAIGASLSVTLTAHAALRGVALDTVRLHLSGAIHGPSFFAPGPSARPGVLDIAIVITVGTALPRTTVETLLDVAVRACPVLQTIRTAPRITLVVEPVA